MNITITLTTEQAELVWSALEDMHSNDLDEASAKFVNDIQDIVDTAIEASR